MKQLAQNVDGFVLSHLGQLDFLHELEDASHLSLIANHTFNTFNTYTIEELSHLGFSKVILSPELTKNQINALGGNIEREIVAYGNICVMTSEYCPVGTISGNFSSHSGCTMPCTKGGKYYLRDRLNMDFRVLPDNIDCQSQIFNAKITSIETNDLNIDSIRIDVIDEDVTSLQEIIDTHKYGKKLSGEQYTNGHINRPV
mgnify:CR=1 FL=1